jgi:DNA-directed RNA polymerase
VASFREAQEAYKAGLKWKDDTDLPSAQKLMRLLVPPLEALIASSQRAAVDSIGGGGRATHWSWPILALPADALAVMTIAAAFRSRVNQSRVSQVAISLAALIHTQIAHDRWVADREAEGLLGDGALRALQARFKNVNRRTWGRWKAAARRLVEEPWSPPVEVSIGGHLLGLLCESAPDVFHIEAKPTGDGRTVGTLIMEEDTKNMLREIDERAAVAAPSLRPMLVPPNPWRYTP